MASHTLPPMSARYSVTLSDDDRETLRLFVSRGTAPARAITRARVLLKTDADGPAWDDVRIAEALDLCPATVQRVRKRFAEEGLDAAVERKRPDRVYDRALGGRGEAELTRLACSTAPEGRARWTLRLLADRMVTLGYEVSHETVRQALKKMRSDLISTSSG